MKAKTKRLIGFIEGLHEFVVHHPQFRKHTDGKSETAIQAEIRPIIIQYLEKYFKEHPEWYSLIGGKRTHHHGQLCLTSEAMRRELTDNALALLRRSPGAGIISISQNDCQGNCQCEKCKAVDEEEGAPSGLMIRFVNAVAEQIEKEFPNDSLVRTGAAEHLAVSQRLAALDFHAHDLGVKRGG